MRDVVETAFGTLQALGIIVVSYFIISGVLALIIGSNIEDKIPTDAQVEQCRVASTANVPREEWNAAYLTGIYKFCERSLTVPAATRAIRISFILVAIAFVGVFLKQIGFFKNKFNTTGGIKKVTFLSNVGSRSASKKLVSYSLEEVDAMLTIVQTNKNKLSRYEAFLAHPMFGTDFFKNRGILDEKYQKKYFMESIELLVRRYTDYCPESKMAITSWIKNNRTELVKELQYVLERKGICEMRRLWDRWLHKEL